VHGLLWSAVAMAHTQGIFVKYSFLGAGPCSRLHRE